MINPDFADGLLIGGIAGLIVGAALGVIFICLLVESRAAEEDNNA